MTPEERDALLKTARPTAKKITRPGQGDVRKADSMPRDPGRPDVGVGVPPSQEMKYRQAAWDRASEVLKKARKLPGAIMADRADSTETRPYNPFQSPKMFPSYFPNQDDRDNAMRSVIRDNAKRKSK
jgi:hypothetical protein